MGQNDIVNFAEAIKIYKRYNHASLKISTLGGKCHSIGWACKTLSRISFRKTWQQTTARSGTRVFQPLRAGFYRTEICAQNSPMGKYGTAHFQHHPENSNPQRTHRFYRKRELNHQNTTKRNLTIYFHPNIFSNHKYIYYYIGADKVYFHYFCVILREFWKTALIWKPGKP